MTAEYTEQPSAWVKLQFEEGEVDFVVSPNLLAAAWETWEIDGREIRVETSAEIIAKKMFHRGDRVTARDLFDLALVIERAPASLLEAKPFLLRHRAAFVEQVRNPHPTLRTAFDAIATLGYTPSFDKCVERTSMFLTEL